MCSIIEGYAVVHQVKQTFRQILSRALLFFRTERIKYCNWKDNLMNSQGGCWLWEVQIQIY